MCCRWEPVASVWPAAQVCRTWPWHGHTRARATRCASHGRACMPAVQGRGTRAAVPRTSRPSWRPRGVCVRLAVRGYTGARFWLRGVLADEGARRLCPRPNMKGFRGPLIGHVYARRAARWIPTEAGRSETEKWSREKWLRDQCPSSRCRGHRRGHCRHDQCTCRRCRWNRRCRRPRPLQKGHLQAHDRPRARSSSNSQRLHSAPLLVRTPMPAGSMACSRSS